MSQGNPQKSPSRAKGGAQPPAFENQGEGDKTSAERYNEDLQRALKKSNYEHKAREAARALDRQEGPELHTAEERGRARAKKADPEIAGKARKPTH